MDREKLRVYSPWILLAVLYMALILIFQDSDPKGDEIRHLRYAKNLTQGFYVDIENPSFRNGPGYPMVLAPFQFLGSPHIIPKLMNGVFLFLAVVYFRKSLALYTSPSIARFGALILGLYPPILRWLPFMYSEALALFLICAFVYYFLKALNTLEHTKRYLVLTSLFLGLLVLTKIIFFHVVVVGLLFLIPCFFTVYRKQVVLISKILVGAVVVISPYLFFTYSWSGKLFYLGTGGGEILYHRSTPFEQEWGNWFSREDVLFGDQPEYKKVKTFGDLSNLSRNHREFYLSIEHLNYIEQDSAFKAKAIENIKNHPRKFLRNTAAGIGRFVWNYPYSYRSQGMGMYLYGLPNMTLLILSLIVFLPVIQNRKEIPFDLLSLLFFSLVYSAGIIALEGRARNFIVVVPFLIGFILYGYSHFMKVELLSDKTTPSKR